MNEPSISLDGSGNPSRPAARAALLMVLAIVLVYACGGPQEGAGAGSGCFRDADCNKGLICVERACSNEVDALVSTVEGPSGEAAMTGGMTSGTDGAVAGTGSAGTSSPSTSMGSTSGAASTSGGAGGTGATTTQGSAGAAGSP